MDKTKANFQTIYQCYKTLFSIDVSEFEQQKMRLSLPVVPIPILSQICDEVHNLFAAEPMVLNISGDVVVVGDLHGHILDLFRIMKKFGSPSKQNYVFLGDLVDRGEFSIETVTAILLMKILWPTHVNLIRGNHEFLQMWKSCGFLNEVTNLYGCDDPIHDFVRVFSVVPVAAIVNGRNLCVHGGIGPDLTSLSQLEELERPISDFNFEPLLSLLWSDPVNGQEGFKKSSRGSGYFFGEKETKKFLDDNHLDLLIRGHQCTDEGVDFMFDNRLVTVFTCSNY